MSNEAKVSNEFSPIDRISLVLVNAIKEQQAEIEAQQAQNQLLLDRLEKQEREIAALRALMDRALRRSRRNDANDKAGYVIFGPRLSFLLSEFICADLWVPFFCP